MVGIRRIFKLRGNRCFSVTSNLSSGHNRWSKIKHDKAKTDASVTKQRSAITSELELASKQFGPDPQHNSRLATIVTAAKKQGFPKLSIENAIARGQGRSLTGAALESLTVEAMIPPSIAMIVECETDSKRRTLSDLKLAIKESSGTMTPTSHMFDRRGKIVFEGSVGVGEEEIFDQAVDAGALDVQIGEGGEVVVYAESSYTTAVADTFAASSGFKLKSLDIVWEPKEDMMVDVASPEALDGFLGRIQDDPSIQDVYTNAT